MKAILKQFAPNIKKFLNRVWPVDPTEEFAKKLSDGAQLKAMVESRGFSIFVDKFIAEFIGDLIRLANDIEAGKINPQVLPLQITAVVARLKNFEKIQGYLSAYEADKETSADPVKMEELTKRQLEYAR